MSEDGRNSSDDSSSPGETVPQIANAALRVAVISRAPDAAQSLWHEIRRRIAKDGEFIALQSSGADAGAAIFHLTAEDLASDEAARTFSATMLASSAPLNFLVRPFSKIDDGAQRRLDGMTVDLKTRARFPEISVSKQAGEAQTEDEALLFQARAIANHLLNNPPPLSSVTLSEFASHEKAARREAKAMKKSKEEVAAKKAGRERKREALAAETVDADRKVRRAQKKAKRKSEKNAAPSGTVPTTTEDDAFEKKKKDRSGNKAARLAEREKRKAEKRAGTAEGKGGRKDKSASKAERRGGKAAAAEAGAPVEGQMHREKRKKKDEPRGEAERLDRKQARAAKRKENRKKNKSRSGDEDSPRPLRVALHGMRESAAAQLRLALERYLAGVPIEWSMPEKKSDISLHGFDVPAISGSEITNQASAIAQAASKLRIFVERSAIEAGNGEMSFAAENRAIAVLAGAFESPLIQLDKKLGRYGENGVSQADIIATSILGIAARGPSVRRKLPRPLPPSPPDLVEARALAATPREFLSQLGWNAAKAPRLLWTRISKESAEAFMNRKVLLSNDGSLDITVPVAWPQEASRRSDLANILGLEFLAGPLNYWYSKANGNDSKKVAEVDAVFKQHGAMATQILSQSGAIILDFVSKHVLSASTAWEGGAVSRRARVFALYILCCKMAAKRKIKFDEAVCADVILHLLDLIEILRSEDFYTPCSLEGLQQDCLVVGLALVLRGVPYAERLLKDSLDRLRTLQFEAGLTADGVWRAGPFSEHCYLLVQFRTLLGDFDHGDAALIEPIAAAAKKMTVFAEAMQKSNGSAPAFDGSREKSFARELSVTRHALASAGFSKSAPEKKVTPPRMTDTYVFRDAQYFVSHSTLKVTPQSSLVILHADPVSFAQSDPGGVTLAFAYGAADLLIRAEQPESKNKRDKGPAFDPALRNGYHIDGVGFASDFPLKAGAARLEKSWRGPGWAAARSIDEINPAGSIARTVIHLKAEHALIVVDELATASGAEASFEQFWHIAPGLTAPQTNGAPYRFGLESGGGLTAAFDGLADGVVEPEGEGHSVRRTLRTKRGIAVSLFQWSAEPAAVLLALKGQPGDWSLDALSAGLNTQLQLSAGELRLAPRAV